MESPSELAQRQRINRQYNRDLSFAALTARKGGDLVSCLGYTGAIGSLLIGGWLFFQNPYTYMPAVVQRESLLQEIKATQKAVRTEALLERNARLLGYKEAPFLHLAREEMMERLSTLKNQEEDLSSLPQVREYESYGWKTAEIYGGIAGLFMLAASAKELVERGIRRKQQTIARAKAQSELIRLID